MTTENTIQRRIRRSPEERLQAMLEQQASLAAQLKAQQKKVAERAAKARADKIAELGELALEMLGPVSAQTLRDILLASGAVLQPAPATDSDEISDSVVEASEGNATEGVFDFGDVDASSGKEGIDLDDGI